MFREFGLLKPFLDNPGEEYHLRELARMLRKSPATVDKNLEVFVKAGVLNKRKMRMYTLYSANEANPFFREIKLFYKKMKKVF
ncbi:hypothetical protein DRJ17_00075 [Candidatus Woesearchaeota archaeon]|nr:MAG: hypothetical protein DRJ17_00075 [Candidatus Woesearchaeota archaeon]